MQPSTSFSSSFSSSFAAARRRHLLGASAVAATLALPAWAGAATRSRRTVDSDADGQALAAVIAGPQRSAANRARDAARHPFETLRFFGLRPEQSMIEIAPGGGWYTEILAPYLRAHGRLALAEDGPNPRLAERLAAEPAVYGHVVRGTLPADGHGFGADIAPHGGVDRVLTFRNVHNWIEAGRLDDLLRAFHAVLRPGGVLGVEEHRAAPGTSLARIIAGGYVPEDFVIARAEAAGFALDGRSEVNANPRDTKDHANGVWSLPPTLRGGAVDRAKYEAIGESDRMTLRFVKPPR